MTIARLIKVHWPLAVSVGVLWITVVVFLGLSLAQNQGHLVYTLDDPYIEMAVAKNLVHHGIWGVSPHMFSSPSSSLLWPLLLAAFYVLIGVNEATPLMLNIVFATALLCMTYLILRRHK